jgi:SpoVK/Ycf46/Vps4 family AAA+-type ATPase
MPRSDLVIELVEAQQRGDSNRFRTLVEAIIAEERSNQHHLVADRLSQLITTSGTQGLLARDDSARQVSDLVHEVVPKRRLADVQMAPRVATAISEVIEEHHRCELLRSHGLEPRNRILLEGPPGNGKTSLAEATAAELMVPFYVVRYEGVVSSVLGETTSRLDHVFEFARTRRCVLFFDEFDTIAKERADVHETGEIKRVVSTLLLQIDRLPSHVVTICATNHGELLDRAAWRRFQLRLPLEAPSRAQATKYLERLRINLGGSLGQTPRTLADKLAGASYAEIEQFAHDVMRRYVLSLPEGQLEHVVRESFKQWHATRSR